ncbi:MAG: hypothetical protein JWL73_2520 [Actinomycetia bacterium]|nr:hypothetical protein [Actinomycetes bacterium]
MLDWSVTPQSVRDAFDAAAEAFSITVAAVPSDAWALPGLGEWTVRDLTGHTSRSLLTVEAYLGQPDVGPVQLQHPVEYFDFLRTVDANSSGIVARGREAGRALGDDPAASVDELVARVTARVDGTPDDAPVATPAGVMRLIDYLPSRVLELTVHRRDITTALGINEQEDLGATVERPAVQLSALLAAGVAVDRPAALDLLLALTGRRPLPSIVTVV